MITQVVLDIQAVLETITPIIYFLLFYDLDLKENYKEVKT